MPVDRPSTRNGFYSNVLLETQLTSIRNRRCIISNHKLCRLKCTNLTPKRLGYINLGLNRLHFQLTFQHSFQTMHLEFEKNVYRLLINVVFDLVNIPTLTFPISFYSLGVGRATSKSLAGNRNGMNKN